MTDIELLKEMLTPGSNIPYSKPINNDDIIILDIIARMRIAIEDMRYGNW